MIINIEELLKRADRLHQRELLYINLVGGGRPKKWLTVDKAWVFKEYPRMEDVFDRADSQEKEIEELNKEIENWRR